MTTEMSDSKLNKKVKPIATISLKLCRHTVFQSVKVNLKRCSLRINMS